MTKLFVGFHFTSETLLSRKITGFRKRFDPKYNQYSFSHMAMLAPFEAKEHVVENLSETLKEELESFFYGEEGMPALEFTGLGIFQNKKKSILYLNPHYSELLKYCTEVVNEVCHENRMPGVKYKENKKQFLPLGYFKGLDDLNVVMDQARIEFNDLTHLPITSINLYEKKYGMWIQRERLIEFKLQSAGLLQLNEVSL